MRQVREIVRLHQAGVSTRPIGIQVGVAASTVRLTLRRVAASGMADGVPAERSDAALEKILFSGAVKKTGHRRCADPDWAAIHRELKRKHVTLTIVWDEYIARYPDGYRYSRFCELYRGWEARLSVTMRQAHRAGEKLFVDYAGDTVPVIVDRLTGETRRAQIFVAVLGASNFLYAEASWTQGLGDWVESHNRALAAIGGVPALLVPDNTKVAVIKACLYDPVINRTYADLAAHYGTAVLPARPYKPRDKAKVEVGVLIAERWLLGRLRHVTFYSLAELNAAIAEFCRRLNDGRVIRRVNQTRRHLLETVERPALRSLPAEPYVLAEWRIRRVGIDYHVEVENHFYSVPHRYARAEVDARLTARTVEVFLRGERIAVHQRGSGDGKHTTVPEHMPSSHRRYADWTIERRPHPARLPGLPRHPAAGSFGHGRAPGRGGRARHGDRRADLSLGQIHSRQQARPAGCGSAGAGAQAAASPQHPRRRLLPLTPSSRRTPMLTHPTLDQLNQLGLLGMAAAFGEVADADVASLTHAEWLALLLEREISYRHDRRLAARLRYAKLRHQAAVEDVDYRTTRGLDRALFEKLAMGEWIAAHDNLILCGPTGAGKSWLASALGHRACRDNRSVLYQRVPKLFADLALARADGRHRRLMRGLISPQLLILDDWGLEPLDAGARHDLLEILEDRYGRRSTIVTSQVPLELWHQLIGDPTYADAILDRLVHNATRIDLTGESLRRKRSSRQQTA